MLRVSRPLALCAAALVASVGLAACSSDGPAPKKPADVGLSIPDVEGMKVGVVVSSVSDPGEGSEYSGPSAGAELAGYRLALGGTKVDVVVVDDQGDADEGQAVVKDLIGQGVSGIVLATSGAHVLPALDAASQAGVPVVAPYLRTSKSLGDGVYVSGPSEAEISAGIENAMGIDKVSTPTLVSADGVPVPDVTGGIGPVEVTGSTIGDTVDDIAKAVEDDKTDSVVVSGSADTQGVIMAALQGKVPGVPIYLTPEALSPDFTDSLVDSGGTTAGRLVAVGSPASESSTLGSSASADSAAAYFAALRLAADDPAFTSDLDGSPFSEVASAADLPSHDAVLALVHAASKAKAVSPDKVAAALDGLKVGVKQSLAGPALNFSSEYALTDEDVASLYATTQAPGVRPAGDVEPLTWFELPTDRA